MSVHSVNINVQSQDIIVHSTNISVQSQDIIVHSQNISVHSQNIKNTTLIQGKETLKSLKTLMSLKTSKEDFLSIKEGKTYNTVYRQ
jgi:hypothetical protein